MEILQGLDGFGMGALDAIAGAGQAVLPLVVGSGVSFGVAEAIDFLVKNTTVKKWKWAIGGVGAALLGAALWKWRSPVDGALAIGSGVLMAGGGYGLEKLIAYKAKKGLMGFGRFVVSPAQPLLNGRYVVAPAQPLFDGMGGMDKSDMVALGLGDPNYVNPGFLVSA